MTTDFASAVAVTIPILALAAGAEARGIRERLKQPDQEWERKFAEYSESHSLDTARPPSEVLEYFRGVPWVSKAYVIERLLAVVSAVMWLAVFVLLAIAELLDLAWLGDGAASGSPGLATFSLVTVGISLAALIMAPAIYLFAPVLLPFDALPHGLKKAVAPKLATKDGHGFLKLVLHEFEGAMTRAADKYEAAAADQQPPATQQPPPTRQPPPPVPDLCA
jgi:hypothetical protein